MIDVAKEIKAGHSEREPFTNGMENAETRPLACLETAGESSRSVFIFRQKARVPLLRFAEKTLRAL